MDHSKLIKIALIPAYQPDEKLKILVDELLNDKFNVVVVDDGSGEEYHRIFHMIMEDVDVISYKKNQGKGYALKKGMQYILDHYGCHSCIVTMDSDGQHRAEDANKICEKAFYNRDCLVIGSRQFDGKVPLKSKVGNTVTRHVFSLKSGTRIYDTQTGLRGFSYSLVKKLIKISGNRYEYEMNVLLHCAATKIPIIEEKIETIYMDDNRGSHFHAVKDSYKIYRAIVQFKNKGEHSRC